jgi:ATP-dependent Clp protease ATP-binding subunit ClpA
MLVMPCLNASQKKPLKVIMLAQEEARRLGHNFVGTEQILLGLIGEGTGSRGQSSQVNGGEPQRCPDRSRKNYRSGFWLCGRRNSLHSSGQASFRTVLRRSRQLGHNYIGTEHLLLGLIREGEGSPPESGKSWELTWVKSAPK